jgi:signal-transduction protein with cAMP-binding, CBS, and nucleotidyltransferase domain
MSIVKSMRQLFPKDGSVLTIRAESDVVTAAKRMCESQVGCLLVVDPMGRVTGIITERDILNSVVAEGASPADVRVGEIMTTALVSCRLDTPISTARRMMAEHRIRHLPIVENGRPLGMISSRDILAHELTEARAVASQQSKVLSELESKFPGITRMTRDLAGRVVI